MTDHILQEIERNLNKVGDDLWGCDDLDDVFDGMLERLSRLEAQLHIQKSLQKTAKLLREHPFDKPLPNQLATRVKHLIKFIFGETTSGQERPTRLQTLDCNVLKFCGLTYTVKEIQELSATQFDFLLANVTDFVHHNKLSQHLYRKDIEKAIQSKFDPGDDNLFKEFLKSHIDHRPAKRKRDEGLDGQQARSDGQQKSTKPNWPHTGFLTGEVFTLTAEDAKAITTSDQVGSVWLTHPYHITSSPFVTVQISKKLSEQFATRRPQML